MGGTGLEHPALTPPETAISGDTRTESGTVKDDRGQNDPDLARLVEAWPTLSACVKQTILDLINEHGGDHG